MIVIAVYKRRKKYPRQTLGMQRQNSIGREIQIKKVLDYFNHPKDDHNENRNDQAVLKNLFFGFLVN
jgi:hypothetical protein